MPVFQYSVADQSLRRRQFVLVQYKFILMDIPPSPQLPQIQRRGGCGRGGGGRGVWLRLVFRLESRLDMIDDFDRWG